MKKAKDLMNNDLTSIGGGSFLSDAAFLLSDKGISGAPVTDDQSRVIGFVSEKDIVEASLPGFVKIPHNDAVIMPSLSRIMGGTENSRNMKVEEFMSKDLFYVSESATFYEVAELMMNSRIRRLPVLRNGRLVGVIERGSLLKAVMEMNRA